MEMRRCPCALFQMANEDSTAFTETEQDGKNIQCQSSGNGISMNGFFLLPTKYLLNRKKCAIFFAEYLVGINFSLYFCSVLEK